MRFSLKKSKKSYMERLIIDVLDMKPISLYSEPSEAELKLLAGYAKEHGHVAAASAFEDMLPVDDRPKRRA